MSYPSYWLASSLQTHTHTHTHTYTYTYRYTHTDRYTPITRTFFPDGSFDLEWVDTSLRMVDLQTEQPRYNTAKHKASFINDS